MVAAPKVVQLFAGSRPAIPAKAPRGTDARELGVFTSLRQHPGHGVTPQTILQIFGEAERGNPERQCDLFDDLVEGDAHLRSLFETRKQAVAGKPWTITSRDEASEMAAYVLREALGRLPMGEVFKWLLDYNRYGWSACEIDWDIVRIDGRDWIVPVWFTPVPARRFRIAQSNTPQPRVVDELRIFTDSRNPHGERLTPAKWIVMRRSPANVAASGLMRTGAWPAMGKRYGFRDMIIFSEKFGLPLTIAKYKTQGEQADDEAITTAEKIVKSIGNDSGAVTPDTIDVEFVEVGRNGDSSKVHGALISHCNRENSKLVNSSTLANDNADSGGASYAMANVHDNVRWESVQSDAEDLQNAFEHQVFTPFCIFNGQLQPAPQLHIQVARNLDPKQHIANAAKLTNELGVKVSVSQLRADTGYREPTDDSDAAPGAPDPASVPRESEGEQS
jgi:phage gp29-like protein